MNFKDYYENVQKTFEYRIKSIYEIDDASMEIIEDVLDKYRPETIGKPKKMMFQTKPLSFTGIENVEVYYVDAVLTVPTTPDILQYDLRTSFGLKPDSGVIMVTTPEGDPVADQEATLEKDAEQDKKEALLNTPLDDGGVDSEEHFGDAYTSKFLAYVKDVESKRKIMQNIDAPHPITKWSQQPKPNEDIDTADFNAGHKAADQKRPSKTLADFKTPTRAPLSKGA